VGAFGGGQVGSTSTTLPGLARHLCLRQVQAGQAVQAAGLARLLPMLAPFLAKRA